MLTISKSVLDAINQRKKNIVSCKTDAMHLALVIEGGGMRGVAAGGMVSALEDMGLTKVFDSVHGSSAGAAAAAYFAVNRAKLGTSLYYEDLNNGQFINKLRLMRGEPILSSTYLVDYAMVERKPFDFEKLQEGHPKLHIVTTDIDIGDSYIVSEFRNYAHYRDLMKASITLPLIAGKANVVDGRRLLDGGLLQQIALKSAESAGATHILALLTRGEHELRRPDATLKTQFEALVLQALYGGDIQKLYLNRNHTINEQVEQILHEKTKSGVPIAAIGLPAEMNYIHRLTTDATVLKKAANEAYNYTLLGLKDISVTRPPIANH